MPRKITADEDMPLRRRGAGAAVLEAKERGMMMRALLYSPKDLVAGALALAAVGAIVANTMFLQTGRHPAPISGPRPVVPATLSGANNPLAPMPGPLPKPRPAELVLRPAELKSIDTRALDTKPVETKAADMPGNPVRTGSTSSAAPSNVARPPAPIPVSSRHDPVGDLITASRRVASVQRALTEYGYGQLKATGTIGSDTQAAIQKFERDRKIPVTGQLSDRLVRELTAMIGRPID